ncbi:hypothetical protein PU630_15595 [Microbacterium horticulturae]|uniref:Uncharacterized protein n=1 Tax=Microbacterium horticulturae TaxID=3028316 RepID=A0ABY8BWW4_9MICO|nr:hypothetical protein [Microbacterium sp. KACC 23027]WEG08648.1 hypothetical protein PU630_15595 [Microbacterium sp. KACC 23027]
MSNLRDHAHRGSMDTKESQLTLPLFLTASEVEHGLRNIPGALPPLPTGTSFGGERVYLVPELDDWLYEYALLESFRSPDDAVRLCTDVLLPGGRTVDIALTEDELRVAIAESLMRGEKLRLAKVLGDLAARTDLEQFVIEMDELLTESGLFVVV